MLYMHRSKKACIFVNDTENTPWYCNGTCSAGFIFEATRRDDHGKLRRARKTATPARSLSRKLRRGKCRHETTFETNETYRNAHQHFDTRTTHIGNCKGEGLTYGELESLAGRETFRHVSPTCLTVLCSIGERRVSMSFSIERPG